MREVEDRGAAGIMADSRGRTVGEPTRISTGIGTTPVSPARGNGASPGGKAVEEKAVGAGSRTSISAAPMGANHSNRSSSRRSSSRLRLQHPPRPHSRSPTTPRLTHHNLRDMLRLRSTGACHRGW